MTTYPVDVAGILPECLSNATKSRLNDVRNTYHNQECLRLAGIAFGTVSMVVRVFRETFYPHIGT